MCGFDSRPRHSSYSRFLLDTDLQPEINSLRGKRPMEVKAMTFLALRFILALAAILPASPGGASAGPLTGFIPINNLGPGFYLRSSRRPSPQLLSLKKENSETKARCRLRCQLKPSIMLNKPFPLASIT